MLWKEKLLNIKKNIYLEWNKFKLEWLQIWELYDQKILEINNLDSTCEMEQVQEIIEQDKRINRICDSFHMEMHNPADKNIVVNKKEEDTWVLEQLYT